MGWLRRLIGLEEKSGITTSAELAAFMRVGSDTRSGVAVTWNSAIEVSTVLACVRVIANGVAQVPWRVYREVEDRRAVAWDHPLAKVVARRPNPWQTSFEFRETALLHVLLAGNAYAFINRVGRAREVRELMLFDPGAVSVKQNPDMSLEYQVTAPSGEHRTFGQDAIWHIRGPSWNGWQGLDATKLAREAIGLSVSLEKGQADFQRRGAKTSGMYTVKNKLSPEKYEMLRSWFEKELASEAAYRPLILDDDAKYAPFTMTGVDQQLIETRKHQIEEICRAFGVMPIMVGHADKTATYASAEQMFLAHVVHTLSPWYQRIEQSANAALLSEEETEAGLYTKFMPNALMRGAAADRAEFYTKALGSGGGRPWMTQNEVRGYEELDRIDDPAADLLAQPGAQEPKSGEEQ